MLPKTALRGRRRAWILPALALLGAGAAALGAPPPASAQELDAPAYLLPFTMTKVEVANPCQTVPSAAALTSPLLDVYAYFPASPVAGVVYFFHGGMGSANNWREREEMAALLDDCARAGYGLVVTESTHRGNRVQPDARIWLYPGKAAELGVTVAGWMTDTVNADEAHIRSIHEHLVRLGRVEPWSSAGPGTPVYLVGFSSGGKFAAAMGYLLRLPPPADLADTSARIDDPADHRRIHVRAAALYCSAGSTTYFAGPSPLGTYPTPVIFQHAVNDDSATYAEVTSAHALVVATVAGAVDVVRNEHAPQRLRADRMCRVPGLSYSDSRAIYQDLLSQGLVDALTGAPLPQAKARALSPALRQRFADYARIDGFRGREEGIDRQLSVLRAEHQVMSNLHGETVRFFKAHP